MPLISAWLVSSIIGLIVSTIGSLLAFGDVRWARSKTGGDADEYRLVAYQRLYAQFARALIFAAWTWLGLLVLGTEPRFDLFVVTFILGNVLLTTVAVSDLLVGIYVRRRQGGSSAITD